MAEELTHKTPVKRTRARKTVESAVFVDPTPTPAPLPPSYGPTSYTPLLMLLLLVASFLLGMMFNKIQMLESKSALGAQTSPDPSKASGPTTADIPVWAKAVGLDMNKFNQCFAKNTYQENVDKDTEDGQTAGVSGTPSFFINGVLIVGAQPYTAFKEAIEQALAGTQTGEKVSVENGHIPPLGRADAPVTMIEFSDFECPFCRTFFQDAFPRIKKEYIDTGKVVLYYRHFPLSIHPLAQPFAQAAECANEQGKFWQMHDKIFTGQEA